MALVQGAESAYRGAAMSPPRGLLFLVLGVLTLGSLVVGALAPVGILPTLAHESPLTGSIAAACDTTREDVLCDASGPYAWRTRGPDGRWQLPRGDAVLVDEEWWTPTRPLAGLIVPSARPEAATLARIRERIAPAATQRLPDRLTAVSLGDVTMDGEVELVLSFRRPFQRNLINITRPRRAWADVNGLSAHVGLFRPHDLSSVWVAGTLVRPVAELAACNGSLAVAYGKLDRPGTVETGAWRWVVFGFLPTEPLPGPGIPTCVDIDGDGRTEPAITGRSVP
jgi:hypothetical protein